MCKYLIDIAQINGPYTPVKKTKKQATYNLSSHSNGNFIKLTANTNISCSAAVTKFSL